MTVAAKLGTEAVYRGLDPLGQTVTVKELRPGNDGGVYAFVMFSNGMGSLVPYGEIDGHGHVACTCREAP